MANEVQNVNANVTLGKPKPTGAIWRAVHKDGTNITMPTNPTSELDVAFKCVGYITEDGLTIGNETAKDVIKAWGGDVVITNQTGRGYNMNFSCMESLRKEVQEMAYGEGAVANTETQMEITAMGDVGQDAAYVIERVLKNGKASRILVPNASITAIGDVTYADENAVVYPFTLAMIKDPELGYFKEFIEK